MKTCCNNPAMPYGHKCNASDCCGLCQDPCNSQQPCRNHTARLAAFEAKEKLIKKLEGGTA